MVNIGTVFSIMHYCIIVGLWPTVQTHVCLVCNEELAAHTNTHQSHAWLQRAPIMEPCIPGCNHACQLWPLSLRMRMAFCLIIPAVCVRATVCHRHNSALAVLQVHMIKNLVRELPIWCSKDALSTLPCPCHHCHRTSHSMKKYNAKLYAGV